MMQFRCWSNYKFRILATLILLLCVLLAMLATLQHLPVPIVTDNYSIRHFSNNTGAASPISLDLPHRCPSGERINFAFIKCMKCATETMGTILRRFGYTRHLNFVLPRKRNLYLGWPFPVETMDYRPSMRPYNALIEHSIYNHSVMSEILPADTGFITIIREPWSHFKSVFHYFRIAQVVDIQNADAVSDVSEYLQSVEKFEEIYSSPEKQNVGLRGCVPNGFSLTRNLMSHCVGMPLGFPSGRENIADNPEAIRTYIHQLDQEFTLVMIFEYFHESLVLLKRLMCWSFKDIVFHLSNVGHYDYKNAAPSPANLAIHRNWSRVDYVLYDHYNKTFWDKVSAQGPSFSDEVALFSVVQSLVSRFCFVEGNWNIQNQTLTVPKSMFNDVFNVTSRDCKLMNTYMLPMIWERYDQEEPANLMALNIKEKGVRPLKGCSLN
jgi:hypothetical protein